MSKFGRERQTWQGNADRGREKRQETGCWFVSRSVYVKSINVPLTYGRSSSRSACKLTPDLLFTSYAFYSAASPSFFFSFTHLLPSPPLYVKSTKTLKWLHSLNLFYRKCSGHARKKRRETPVISLQNSWFYCRWAVDIQILWYSVGWSLFDLTLYDGWVWSWNLLKLSAFRIFFY